MVRAYHPQSFPGSIQQNTNYPPQSHDESGGSPSGNFEAYNDGEGNSGDILYNDGSGNSGKVIVSEGE